MNLKEAMRVMDEKTKARVVKAAQAIVNETQVAKVSTEAEIVAKADGLVAELGKYAEIAKLLTGFQTDVIAKAGAKYSKDTKEKLAAAHDMVDGIHKAAGEAKKHIKGMMADGEEEDDDDEEGEGDDKTEKTSGKIKILLDRIEKLEKFTAVPMAASGKGQEVSKLAQVGEDGVPVTDSRGRKLTDAEVAYERARKKAGDV